VHSWFCFDDEFHLPGKLEQQAVLVERHEPEHRLFAIARDVCDRSVGHRQRLAAAEYAATLFEHRDGFVDGNMEGVWLFDDAAASGIRWRRAGRRGIERRL
jgi:hypothetical protein